MQLESSQLLRRLKPLFQENFEKFGELGAAVSVWQNGKPIIDFAAGFGTRVAESVDERHTRFGVVGDEGNRQRVCLAYVARTPDRYQPTRGEFWPEFVQAVKKKSRLRSCCRIKPGFALWIGESMCSTTTQ